MNRRTQLAKSTLLTCILVPLRSFRSFKISSDAKERVGCGKQREATAPIQSQAKLQPWFLSLRWKTCLRQNCSLGSSACSEGLARGQNTLTMIDIPGKNHLNVSEDQIYFPLLGSKISDLISVLNFFLLSGKSVEAMLLLFFMHGTRLADTNFSTCSYKIFLKLIKFPIY